MNCPDCLSPLPDGASFCERCGAQVNPYAVRPEAPNPRKSSTVLLVSLVVAILLVVQVLPIVIVYWLTNQEPFTGPSTPTAFLDRSAIQNGIMIDVVSVSEVISWQDVQILFSDSTNTVGWTPTGSDLEGPSPLTVSQGFRLLGNLELDLNITDVRGNGVLEGGDYFMLMTGPQTFSPDETYSFRLIYKPTSDVLGSVIFTG